MDGAGNVYVVDSENNRIQQFDSDGAFIATWGSEGGGNGEFRAPFFIAIDGDQLYVTERHNNRVQTFLLVLHAFDGSGLSLLAETLAGEEAVWRPRGLLC